MVHWVERIQNNLKGAHTMELTDAKHAIQTMHEQLTGFRGSL